MHTRKNVGGRCNHRFEHLHTVLMLVANRNNNQTFENYNNQVEGLTDGYSHNVCFVDFDRDGEFSVWQVDHSGRISERIPD